MFKCFLSSWIRIHIPYTDPDRCCIRNRIIVPCENKLAYLWWPRCRGNLSEQGIHFRVASLQYLQLAARGQREFSIRNRSFPPSSNSEKQLFYIIFLSNESISESPVSKICSLLQGAKENIFNSQSIMHPSPPISENQNN